MPCGGCQQSEFIIDNKLEDSFLTMEKLNYVAFRNIQKPKIIFIL